MGAGAVAQYWQRKFTIITFADSNKNKFLTANAIAAEVSDIAKMQELWDPTLKAWFKEGLETPGIILLKLNLEEAEF